MPHADPEARRLYHRDYKRRNRWRYRARDKAWGAARNANLRARRAGVGGAITADQASAILAIGRCHYCGRTGEVTLDHAIPLARGGANIPSNIVPACDHCNKTKSTGDSPAQWSRRVDSCRRCGTTDRPHLARDMCSLCYRRTWGSRAAKRARAVATSGRIVAVLSA